MSPTVADFRVVLKALIQHVIVNLVGTGSTLQLCNIFGITFLKSEK